MNKEGMNNKIASVYDNLAIETTTKGRVFRQEEKLIHTIQGRSEESRKAFKVCFRFNRSSQFE